jgi:hypothetical protein
MSGQPPCTVRDVWPALQSDKRLFLTFLSPFTLREEVETAPVGRVPFRCGATGTVRRILRICFSREHSQAFNRGFDGRSGLARQML